MRAFPNRWPPFPDGRAEIVLYTSDHDASFADLSPAQARCVVDLWAERSTALGADPGVAYVLVFENRGPEVGATIAHPHGQIYGFHSVPPAAMAELGEGQGEAGLGPEAPGDRLVAAAPGRLAGMGAGGRRVALRARARPGAGRARPAVARRRGPGRPRPTAGRRGGSTRRPLRGTDAVHAVVPPTTLRRRRLADGAAPRPRRASLPVPRYAAVRGRRRAGQRGVVQPGRPGRQRRRRCGASGDRGPRARTGRAHRRPHRPRRRASRSRWRSTWARR